MDIEIIKPYSGSSLMDIKIGNSLTIRLDNSEATSLFDALDKELHKETREDFERRIFDLEQNLADEIRFYKRELGLDDEEY